MGSLRDMWVVDPSHMQGRKNKVKGQLYECSDCDHIWKTKNKHSGPYKCPKCNSKDILEK